jgi:hypothetical protein
MRAADSSGDRLLRKPITGFAGCCASAASGAARRAAEITPMNARRSITGPTPNAVGQSGAKEDGA